MKPITKIFWGVVLLVATSCSEQPNNMLTVISPDGSCRRDFYAYVDSAFMTSDFGKKKNPFPVEIDSTYIVAWQYRNGEIKRNFPVSPQEYEAIVLADTSAEMQIRNKEFLVFISRRYKSVEEMATQFRLKPDHAWSKMNIQYRFEKKFRFFYTYYLYQETYPRLDLPFDVPLENYMTKEESDFWFTGVPNLTEGMNGVEAEEYLSEIERKYRIWFEHNRWNMQYDFIASHYDMVENPPVSKEEFIALKDTVFETVYNMFGIDDMKMGHELDAYFKTDVFKIFEDTKDSTFTSLDDLLLNEDFVSYFSDCFAYRLIMPGKVTSSNGVMRGDTLNWNLTAYRMIPDNYVLEAKSQKLNIPIVLLTVILALTAIGIFIYRRKQEKMFR